MEDGTMTDNSRLITIETSCGKTIVQAVKDMTDWQLEILLKQNGERTDVDPADLAAMRDELRQRCH